MSNPHLESAGEFTIGSVLGRAKTILFTQPRMFMGLAFIAFVPPTLVQLLGGSEFVRSLGKFLNFIFTMIIQGAFACGVFQIINGHAASFGASLSRGMTRFFPIAGASILTGLGIVLGAMLPLVPGVILDLPLLMIVGALLDAFLIPWLMCKWTLVIPACVVEHLGPIGSMRRSSELTKGYRLKILGLQSLAYLLFLVFAVVAILFYGFLNAVFLALFGPLAAKAVLLLMLDVFLSLPMAFLCVTATTTYYDLRSVKEGISVDSLANVFD